MEIAISVEVFVSLENGFPDAGSWGLERVRGDNVALN